MPEFVNLRREFVEAIDMVAVTCSGCSSEGSLSIPGHSVFSDCRAHGICPQPAVRA